MERDFKVDLIYSYSRKQAIQDGVLIEVPIELSKESGFTVPIALTSKLYNEWIIPTENDRKYGQSEEGRLWDVLHLLKTYSKNTKGDTLYFYCYFIKNKKLKKVRLKSIIHPDDDLKPVITIMLDDED